MSHPEHTSLEVGDRVRISRDEELYPSRGTWPRYRGKTGTVVEINVDRLRPHLTEYGVVFGKIRSPRANGSIAMDGATWFKEHELVTEIPALASQRLQSAADSPTPTDLPRKTA